MNIPVNHIIFIPAVLAIGFMLGWKLGSRSVQNQWDRSEKRRREREEA